MHYLCCSKFFMIMLFLYLLPYQIMCKNQDFSLLSVYNALRMMLRFLKHIILTFLEIMKCCREKFGFQKVKLAKLMTEFNVISFSVVNPLSVKPTKSLITHKPPNFCGLVSQVNCSACKKGSQCEYSVILNFLFLTL